MTSYVAFDNLCVMADVHIICNYVAWVDEPHIARYIQVLNQTQITEMYGSFDVV